MSKRMKLIFTISLLLNIAFAGTAAGMFYRFCQERIDIPGEMTPEARHFMAMTFQKGREEVKPLIDDVKKQRKIVEAVITAEKFDAKAYDEAAKAMLDTRDAITRKRSEIMSRALVDLPLKDRELYARKILDGLEGRKPPHKGGYHSRMQKDKDGEGKPKDEAPPQK